MQRMVRNVKRIFASVSGERRQSKVARDGIGLVRNSEDDRHVSVESTMVSGPISNVSNSSDVHDNSGAIGDWLLSSIHELVGAVEDLSWGAVLGQSCSREANNKEKGNTFHCGKVVVLVSNGTRR